jgi:HEAT repeat protein
MGSGDQVVAFFAYQSLLERVMRATAPGREEEQKSLIAALGEALSATAKTKAGGPQPASFGNNPFLKAVASQSASFEHPPAARANLARLLGYMPHADAVPHLAKALDDLDAREMARCSLEANPSEASVDALLHAVEQPGTGFRIGVINSLAKRKASRAAPALKVAARDEHPEIRMAALAALAALPEPAHDGILEEATRSGHAAERRMAHVCRVRLAECLLASGRRQDAARISKSVLASDAAEPQKKAARLALAQL